MRLQTKFLASLAAVVFAMTMAGTARAQQVQTQPGVARVSVIEGNVSMQRGDSGSWIAVTVNTPLLSGDTISTGPNSRAEVQLDYANVLRLASNSTAKIATLDGQHIQVQVSQGLVNFDVLNQDNAQAEIDTPNVAIRPDGNGRYRVEVDPNSQTSYLTVERGQADVSTPQGSTRVDQGQLITIEGTNNPQYRVTNAPAADAWDYWNQKRDREILDSPSWHYTDRYYTGAQDLGAYGRWVYAPDYGWVWTPYESAGWAPYRVGRWAWEPYYGWTWVSYEPWGWAPYHYGRWFLYDNAWAWWPGPIGMYPSYYPVWAPAYVSFFGFGGGNWGLSIGFGFGNVGWLPIGPADPFFPWYGGWGGVSVFSFNNYYNMDRDWRNYHCYAPLYGGRGGYSNFRGVFNNQRLRGGLSWMRSNEFGRGPVPHQQRMIDATMLRQGRMFGGRVPLVPSHASLQVVDRAPNPASYRRGFEKTQFFTKGRPAPAQRPFREQQASMQRFVQTYRAQGGGKFGNRVMPGPAGRSANTFSNARAGAPTPAMNRSGKANGFTPRNGWNGFGGTGTGRQVQAFRGQPQQNGGAMKGATRTGAPAQGWHTFGDVGRGSQSNGAWMQQGRGTPNNSRSRTFTPSPAQRQQGGFRTFTPGASSQGARPAMRQPGNSPSPAARPGWKVFTPRSGQQPRNSPPARGGSSGPARSPGGWQSFRPSSRPSAQGSGWRQSGRQPLNLRQPIVSRRGGPQYGSSGPRNYGGGNYRAPAYHAPAYRGPSGNYGGYNRGGGGGYRAPAYHAPAYRAPSRNFGGYRGGGGYRAPAYHAPAYHAPARPSAPHGGGGGRGGRRH